MSKLESQRFIIHYPTYIPKIPRVVGAISNNSIQENSLPSSTFVVLHCHVLPFLKAALDHYTSIPKTTILLKLIFMFFRIASSIMKKSSTPLFARGQPHLALDGQLFYIMINLSSSPHQLATTRSKHGKLNCSCSL
jgi:hypothetical protein